MIIDIIYSVQIQSLCMHMFSMYIEYIYIYTFYVYMYRCSIENLSLFYMCSSHLTIYIYMYILYLDIFCFLCIFFVHPVHIYDEFIHIYVFIYIYIYICSSYIYIYILYMYIIYINRCFLLKKKNRLSLYILETICPFYIYFLYTQILRCILKNASHMFFLV